MKKDVTVTFNISVEVDETKFTPEFLQIFKEVFYNFDTIEEHIENLAKLKAMDMIEDNFIEGYGEPKNMGIKCRIEDVIAEIDN